jgi:hypothetical protein
MIRKNNLAVGIGLCHSGELDAHPPDLQQMGFLLAHAWRRRPGWWRIRPVFCVLLRPFSLAQPARRRDWPAVTGMRGYPCTLPGVRLRFCPSCLGAGFRRSLSSSRLPTAPVRAPGIRGSFGTRPIAGFRSCRLAVARPVRTRAWLAGFLGVRCQVSGARWGDFAFIILHSSFVLPQGQFRPVAFDVGGWSSHHFCYSKKRHFLMDGCTSISSSS